MKTISPPDIHSGNQNEPSKAHPRYYLLIVRHKHPLINILHSKTLAGLFFFLTRTTDEVQELATSSKRQLRGLPAEAGTANRLPKPLSFT